MRAVEDVFLFFLFFWRERERHSLGLIIGLGLVWYLGKFSSLPQNQNYKNCSV